MSRAAYIGICVGIGSCLACAPVYGRESIECPEVISPQALQNNEHDILLKLVEACLHSGKPVQSIAVLSELIRTNPSDAFSYMNRGFVRVAIGEIEQGVDDLTSAINLKPDLPEAWYNRGNVYLLHFQQYDKAISDFSEAIKLNSDFALAYCGRGLAKFQLGRYGDALADFDLGISRDPKQTYCHSNRGNLYLLTRQYQKAIDDLSVALNDRPSDAFTLSRRGEAFEGLGQKDRALQDYRAALTINSSLKSAREGINRLGEN